jgi:hypothetical protein
MIKFNVNSNSVHFLLHDQVAFHHSPVLKKIATNKGHTQAIYTCSDATFDAHIYAHAMHWFYTQTFHIGIEAPNVRQLYELGFLASSLKIVKLHNQVVDAIVENIKDGKLLSQREIIAIGRLVGSDSLIRLFNRHCAIMLANGVWNLPDKPDVNSEILWKCLRTAHQQLAEMLEEENIKHSPEASNKYHIISELGFRGNSSLKVAGQNV